MAEPVEQLQKMEGACQRMMDLLTQAVQDIQEAVHLSDDLFNSHKPHPVIDSAIKAVQGNLAAITNTHNDLIARIREAQNDSEYLANPNENSN